MSFDPSYPHNLKLLPPDKPIVNRDFGDLLLHARVELAELKGACGKIPNPMLLAAPTIIRESVASSNIENINTTLAEVLQWQLFPESEQRPPDKEVLRYREGLYWGFENLSSYALSSRIITGVQSRIVPSGNGQYRREQNRIVNLNSHEDLYTPPPANDISRLMENWENYVNAPEASIDPLIRTVIAHYQFEAIHPFRDGNGRTGRVLMILQLIQNELLNLPVLYISGYINQHRSDYYRYLLGVTAEDDWHQFISFMLLGFQIQAKETRNDIDKICELFQEYKDRIKIEGRKIYSAELVEALFTYPIITPTKLATCLGIHYTTASRHLLQLTKMRILKDAMVGKYHLFSNHQLLKILVK